MRIIRSSDRDVLEQFASRDEARNGNVERQAARIVSDVRRRGDAAVREWTEKLEDRLRRRNGVTTPPATARKTTRLSTAEIKRGWAATPEPVRAAISLAVKNLESVAARQVPRPFVVNVGPGHIIEQRVQPLRGSAVTCRADDIRCRPRC